TLARLADLAVNVLEQTKAFKALRASYNAELVQREIREDRIGALMREVTHRSKNMLAVVLAFARQSAHEGQNLNDYRGRLISRIEGLAHTQDLVAEAEWRSADVGELIVRQLTPFL